ncbi:zhit-2, partial [Pristionchus pacificus]
ERGSDREEGGEGEPLSRRRSQDRLLLVRLLVHVQEAAGQGRADGRARQCRRESDVVPLLRHTQPQPLPLPAMRRRLLWHQVFKGEAHAACSEDFYRGCVKEELQGKQAEHMDDHPLPETFEEMMKAYLAGKRETMPGTSGTDEDAGEPLYDSDDEDPSARGEGGQGQGEEEEHYLDKVLQGTVDGYEDEEEADVERKLMCMGVGSELEALMAALNDDEREAFAALAEQVYQEEQGLGASCFKKK